MEYGGQGSKDIMDGNSGPKPRILYLFCTHNTLKNTSMIMFHCYFGYVECFNNMKEGNMEGKVLKRSWMEKTFIRLSIIL